MLGKLEDYLNIIDAVEMIIRATHPVQLPGTATRDTEQYHIFVGINCF